MNEDRAPLLNEYCEMFKFICELQESALQQSGKLLAEKKELEYKKKQQEFMIKEREKNRIPNIAMFSPLTTEDIYENDISWKDELENLERKLAVAEEQWEKQKTICKSFDRLKTFFSSIEKVIVSKDIQNNNSSGYSTELSEIQNMDIITISRKEE